MELLNGVSCWYLVIAIAWSLYQGARGVIETRLNNRDKNWQAWQKVLVLDIHDFAFRFVCTMAGFLALFVSYRIAESVDLLADLSTGAAALLVFSFMIGVIGVGGQLHYIILLGKLPPAKGG